MRLGNDEFEEVGELNGYRILVNSHIASERRVSIEIAVVKGTLKVKNNIYILPVSAVKDESEELVDLLKGKMGDRKVIDLPEMRKS